MKKFFKVFFLTLARDLGKLMAKGLFKALAALSGLG